MTRQDFYPSYAKAAAVYAQEYPPGSNKPWPYDKPVQQRAIENLFKDVVDPSTQEYYKNKDGEPPRKYITDIVRVRTFEGKEYLYSNGYVRFYTMFGDLKIETCNKQEAYEHANFLHETRPDPKDGHIKRFTMGIEDKVIKYDLSWTPENIDKLLELQSPRGCTLTLWDDKSSPPGKECPDIEMFKTKPFDYIYRDEYLTPEEKELAIRQHEALTGQQITTSSTSSKANKKG
jgi:hypothetical protein